MNQDQGESQLDEVESQLSAMFDGELPAAECELLSRRIARDENLRTRWSRYALIGAAMRSEPVATAGRGFAVRVSAAIDSSTARAPRRLRRQHMLRNTALAATLVAGVAGLSVSMLREVAFNTGTAPVLRAAAARPDTTVAASPVFVTSTSANPGDPGFGGPLSYVTPAGNTAAATMLRTQLADYIVAHSAYSPPLLRRNVLSELMTSEDQMGIANYSVTTSAAAKAGAADVAGTARGTAADGSDAIRPIPASSR